MAASVALPPGFRFHPTDEELVGYYLHRKAGGLDIELEVIPVLDLYKFEPWQLPEKSFLPQGDMEWFFFCPRDRKYPNGSRTNRATKTGYWKATGKDRRVVCPFSVTGFRKTLVFHRGRAPVGDRTEWVMHEYRICDESFPHSSTSPGAFALCRVMKKNDIAQKNDNQRGSHSSHMGFDELSSIITDNSYSSSDYPCGKEHKATSPPAPFRDGERPLWTSPYMQELVYHGECEGQYLQQSTFPCSEMTGEQNVAEQPECWDDFRGHGYTSWCQTDKDSMNLCENGGLFGKNTWRF